MYRTPSYWAHHSAASTKPSMFWKMLTPSTTVTMSYMTRCGGGVLWFGVEA